MSRHAKLSPSAAKRWLTCTPSAVLEATLPDDGAESPYAAEGTAAHKLAEIKLKGELGKVKKQTAKGNVTKFRKNNERHSIDFERHVDEYVEQVLEIAGSYGNPYIDLEQRVAFEEYVPGGFGTSDVVIVAEPVLHIIDLKFGQGVPVSAEDNPQLMLYALGTYLKYAIVYDFETVAMTIIQPRLYETSTYEIPAKTLMDWAEGYVADRATMAHYGEGEYCPTEEACRWCKAKAICRARAEANLELAKLDFAPPPTLTDSEIADLLEQVGELKRWAGDVENYALAQARDHGVHFEGYKLVEGRSIRKWIDPAEAETWLIHNGYENIYTEPELKSITALEKDLGKAAFEEALSEFVFKPPGKPALVPVSDKRPEINSAEAAARDFAENE